MPADRSDVLQGTLDLLILQLLARDPDHGWGLTLKLEEHSGGVLLVNQGSLYPALERLTPKAPGRPRQQPSPTPGARQRARDLLSRRHVSALWRTLRLGG